MNFGPEERLAAFDLAVSYNALLDELSRGHADRTRSNWNSISVWAGILRATQTAIGVELMPDAALKNYVEQAEEEKRRIDRMVGDI